MGINSIDYNQKLTSALDKALVQKAATGLFIDNVLKTNFVGAKTVLIPEVDMQALGDYNRDTGFVEGTVTVTNTPYTLSQDRGRSFQIDRQDADESGVAELMGKISAEFVRTKVIPEMDAYVLSKLAQQAMENEAITGDPTTGALKMLKKAIMKAQDAAGYDEELVAFVDGAFYDALQNDTSITRILTISEFKHGDITTKVHTLDGVPILPVQSSRMKTEYNFLTGEEGQEAGGFAPTEDAQNIGLLVLPKKAASLVKKTEETRTFSPQQNQKADAWKLDYRLYYDLFVKKSYKDTIFAYIH